MPNLFHITTTHRTLGLQQLLCSRGPGQRLVWRTPSDPRCKPLAVSVADAFALAQFLKFLTGKVLFQRVHVGDSSGAVNESDEVAVGVEVGFAKLAVQSHFSDVDLLAAARDEDLANFWGSHSISPDVDAWISANWPSWKAYFTNYMGDELLAKAAQRQTN